MTWILSVASILNLWIMLQKCKWAPLVGTATQVLWMIYVVNTEQWGLFPGVIAYTLLNVSYIAAWWTNSTLNRMEERNSEDAWCAAEKALILIARDFDSTDPDPDVNHPGWWGCRYCEGEKYHHPELHTADKCPVAAAQVALALMRLS